MQKLNFLLRLARFRRRVYLDHNATTGVSRRVRRRMNHVLKHNTGNPSALYGLGREAAEIVEEARRHVAAAVHAEPDEICFTGSATEANNAVLRSLSRHDDPRKRKIISTPIEHPSVINTLEFLKTEGIVVDFCRVDRHGRVLLEDLERRIDGETFLVCCMAANNEIGTLQDIQAIARIARRNGALVLSDCVQALGKIPVDVHEWGIDYASFSAHKLHGPKGVGALYIRRGSPFAPFIHGGHQENGRRAGTESLHDIAGFGAACRDVGRLLAKTKRIEALKRQLIRQLREIKPDCEIHSPPADCLPNTISVTLPQVNNAELMAALDYHGIAVSAGSACSAHDEKPSHVLKAIGLPDRTAAETIRISLGSDTSAREVRYAARVFRDCVAGGTTTVQMIAAAQLDEARLFDEQTYILDVRPRFMRRKLKSLPNAHETSFVLIGRHRHLLPRDKHILVVCQRGNLSAITALYLKSKGFARVSSLQSGVAGWKARHADLYEKYAGQNVAAL